MWKYILALGLTLQTLFVFVRTTDAITFGVGYVNPDGKGYNWSKLAEMYNNIGVHSVKFQQIRWGDIEPAPPKKDIHKYQWNVLDSLVTIVQTAGFTEIEMVLEANSPWGNRPLTKNDTQNANKFQLKKPSLPPKEEHWKDYSAFINNIVERYDGDGNNDMPGLKYPILNYEIETEAQGTYHWLGTAEEYTKMLKAAYISAKKANPHVKIILTGFWLGDVADPNEPCEKRIEKINQKMLRRNWNKYMGAVKRFLKEKDCFDMVEIHSLGDYTAIYTAVKWIRQEMKQAGYEKPIYIGDACATPTLTLGPVKPHPHPFKMEAQEVVKVLANKKNAMQKEVDSWYRAEQSRLIVKKTVAALEMGLEKINFGFMMDNTSVNKAGVSWLASLNPLAFNWLIAGIVDVNYNPYPAYFTYKITIDKLNDAKFVKRLSLEQGIYGFEFLSKEGPIYVLWSVKNANIDFTVSPPFKAVRITDIVTELGQRTPTVKEKTVKEGCVKLNLIPNPIFLEPL